MTRQITIEEVKKHKRKSSVWMIIHNDVYDVTSFLEEHPGGEESLLAFAGKDGTQVFEDVNHSEDARELMKKYKIGSLPPEQHNTNVVTCRREFIKSETTTKSIKHEPKADRRVGTIVVPKECHIPPRHCRPRGFPCGEGSDYKWVLLAALAGAVILGIVLKKHLAS